MNGINILFCWNGKEIPLHIPLNQCLKFLLTFGTLSVHTMKTLLNAKHKHPIPNSSVFKDIKLLYVKMITKRLN